MPPAKQKKHLKRVAGSNLRRKASKKPRGDDDEGEKGSGDDDEGEKGSGDDGEGEKGSGDDGEGEKGSGKCSDLFNT